MSLRIIARRAASIRSFPTSSLASSSSSLPSLARFKSSSDDVPQTPRDPYPLPLSHPVSQDPLDSTMAELTSFEIPPLDRSHEDIETTRKRLVYQARKRGMLEGDLLLATFAREKLALMKPDEVTEFDKLLDEPDWDIYYWLTDKKPLPERWQGSALIDQLRIHTKNEGRVVRFMPALDDQPTSSV